MHELNRDIINSRPTAKRKLREFEVRLAQQQWEKEQRWEPWKNVGLAVLSGFVVFALVALAAWFVPLMVSK